MSKRASILKYYEDLAGDYDQRFNNLRLNYMRSVEKMVILGSLKPGMILDIGCGTGEQSLFLAKKGYQVVGVDISREMLLKAKKSAKEGNIKENLSLVLACAEALPFRDRSFEGLISIFGVFNHIPHVHNAFQETFRVLKSDATAIFTVVNRWNLTWWIYALLRFKFNWLIASMRSKEYTVNGLWTYYFSRNDIKRLLGNIGFKVSVGCMLLFVFPFNKENLLFYEKWSMVFEDAVRWKSPFNSLGYYLLVRVEK
ncbi:MAG: class I SAM-dependent methyltransferase [Candidatus Methanoperedens sp.]|nr:class I SAM-dependent methyltransferase [Candidatus Methanoperedens sp.]